MKKENAQSQTKKRKRRYFADCSSLQGVRRKVKHNFTRNKEIHDCWLRC